MFRCEITGRLSRQGKPETDTAKAIPAEKCNKIVVRTRTREYRNWDRENEEEWFSHGEEIVKEVNATDEGLAIWNKMTAEQRLAFCEARGW